MKKILEKRRRQRACPIKKVISRMLIIWRKKHGPYNEVN